ncbi:ATP-binding protein [Paenibacillus ihuae]|uniref:ATP-binding protein n=1 Tax=Paenibacillus ihuae TaxID=1232431 RepID=UPI0006D5B2F0|nr:sensor histidine kinase [Paenibacillus ihuae]
MNTVLREELVYLLTFPLVPVILHYFFSRFLTCRLTGQRPVVLSGFLYIACNFALHYSSLPGLLLLAANVGLTILFSLLYRGEWIRQTYCVLFITALLVLSEAVMPYAYTDTGYVANLLLSKLLALSLVLLLLRTTKGDGHGRPAGGYLMVLLLCPVLSIFALFWLSESPFFQVYPNLFPIVPTLLLAINLLVFVLSDHALYVQSEKTRRQLLEQQNTYYVHQYLMTRDHQEEAFKFQHDFKNILLGLRAKLQSGDEHSSSAELDRLLGKLVHPPGGCDTGNPVIDSIVNYKKQTAAEQQIGFRLGLSIPPQLELDATVISVILGNALDNAIEACGEPSLPERYVSIEMNYLNDSLFIRIRNPFAHKIRTGSRGEISSTKAGPHPHGIGLQNIRQTVSEWGGLLEIAYDSGLFQLEIVLFHVQRRHSA